jgi:hypothetical protein
MYMPWNLVAPPLLTPGSEGVMHVITFGIAWAQAPTPPVTPAAPGAGTAAQGGGMAAAGFLVVIGLLILVGIAVKLYDRKRKRDAEAVHLQAQVSDALMRDAGLAGLLLTPTAHLRGGEAIVEISGEVPDEAAREAALRIAREEAARIRPDVRIEDHVRVGAVRAA